MWNDEDNNPYSSFDRRDDADTSVPYGASDQAGFQRSASPDPTAFGAHSGGTSKQDEDDDNDFASQRQSKAKKGSYDSRIEQTLYENHDLQILIVDASKSHEGGGNYIAYTIRTGDLEVRRRYSEFASLRNALVNLHPTLIIPPIPEKHSMADYAAKPTKAKEDTGIIDLRKRMLAVFLNRCRRMPEVREDGVWWRFLDPNVSWNEVLHSPLLANIPKSNMKAPPLDPANPTAAHGWLPVPSTSAKLKSASKTSSTGTPVSSPQTRSMSASTATSPGPATQVFGRFPPTSQQLSEEQLDPYFNNFESATRDLEQLLQGNIEKVNRRTISHLQALAADMAELGARLNAFSLSEQSQTVAAAIERIGQAVDSSYIATEELSSTLSATFAEPMRESAQFASVVRSVLRYRIMKRIQEEMTKDELASKRQLLDSLEKSEQEAQRIEQYLNSTGSPRTGSTANTPRRSNSARSQSTTAPTTPPDSESRASGDNASGDSDFPPTHSDSPSSNNAQASSTPSTPTARTRSRSGGGGFGSGSGSITNKIFGRISHTFHGIVDVDPERTRRDQMGKTKESLVHLEQALQVSEQDVKDASAGVMKDLRRFQADKEEDLKRYMIAYAKCHIDWAKKNVETWREAREEVDKIELK